jgi:hypothetical protein
MPVEPHGFSTQALLGQVSADTVGRHGTTVGAVLPGGPLRAQLFPLGAAEGGRG